MERAHGTRWAGTFRPLGLVPARDDEDDDWDEDDPEEELDFDEAAELGLPSHDDPFGPDAWDADDLDDGEDEYDVEEGELDDAW